MKLFSWLGTLMEWLFDYEFYWWYRARKKSIRYQESSEFRRDKLFCRIKGWLMVILGLGAEFGYIGYITVNDHSGSYLIIITCTLVSIFLTEFGLLHLFAASTRPKAKNE